MDAYEPGIRAQIKAPIELDPKSRESGVELGVESGAIQLEDPVIEKAQRSTNKARAKMVLKYSKRHDI